MKNPEFERICMDLFDAQDMLDMARVQQAMRDHPQYSAQLLEFAAAARVAEAAERDCDKRGAPVLADEDALIERALARALGAPFIARDAAREPDTRPAEHTATEATTETAPSANPFAALSPTDMRAMSAALHLPRIVLGKLRDGLIEQAPARLVRALAEYLKLDIATLKAHLAAPPSLPAGTRFKSRGKPRTGTRQSFEQALRASRDQDAIRFWLDDNTQD